MTRARALTPYTYQVFLLLLIPLAFFLDIHTKTLSQQNLLGVGAWIILFAWTRLSPPLERRQVWIMVAIATAVEIWSSVIWGVYRYRFGNVPLFVPPGHGLVYLFALRAGRTPIVQRYSTQFSRLALLCAAAWAIGGMTLEPWLLHRWDLLGAMWLPLFVWFMRKPSAPIYAAAFFVTSYLELWGTHFGNWAWQAFAPISHIPSGNPPSVISAGYCLMDFLSIMVATSLPAAGLLSRVFPRLAPRAADSSG